MIILWICSQKSDPQQESCCFLMNIKIAFVEMKPSRILANGTILKITKNEKFFYLF